MLSSVDSKWKNYKRNEQIFSRTTSKKLSRLRAPWLRESVRFKNRRRHVSSRMLKYFASRKRTKLGNDLSSLQRWKRPLKKTMQNRPWVDKYQWKKTKVLISNLSVYQLAWMKLQTAHNSHRTVVLSANLWSSILVNQLPLSSLKPMINQLTISAPNGKIDSRFNKTDKPMSRQDKPQMEVKKLKSLWAKMIVKSLKLVTVTRHRLSYCTTSTW